MTSAKQNYTKKIKYKILTKMKIARIEGRQVDNSVYQVDDPVK